MRAYALLRMAAGHGAAEHGHCGSEEESADERPVENIAGAAPRRARSLRAAEGCRGRAEGHQTASRRQLRLRGLVRVRRVRYPCPGPRRARPERAHALRRRGANARGTPAARVALSTVSVGRQLRVEAFGETRGLAHPGEPPGARVLDGGEDATDGHRPQPQGWVSRKAATASMSLRFRFCATPCMIATLRMLLWNEASCFRTYCACCPARRGKSCRPWASGPWQLLQAGTPWAGRPCSKISRPWVTVAEVPIALGSAFCAA